MRIFEIIGYNCGHGVLYDPAQKSLRLDRNVSKPKLTLRGLRRMKHLKAKQKKI